MKSVTDFIESTLLPRNFIVPRESRNYPRSLLIFSGRRVLRQTLVYNRVYMK